jgi:putative nucleotidyltransferase with HDIG domain
MHLLSDLIQTADKAQNDSDYATAIDFYSRALELADQPGYLLPEADRYDLLACRAKCYGKAVDLDAQAADLACMELLAQGMADLPRQISAAARRAFVTIRLGKAKEALQIAENGLQLAQQIGDVKLQGDCLSVMGSAYRILSDYPRALSHLEAAQELYHHAGDTPGEAIVLHRLGACLIDTDQSQRGQECLREALSLFRTIGDRYGEAYTLNLLGTAAGDCAQQRSYFEQALAVWRLSGDEEGQARVLNHLSMVYVRLGLYARARQYACTGVETMRRMKVLSSLGPLLETYGRACLESGDYAAARLALEEAVSIEESLGDRFSWSHCRLTMGRLEMAQGKFEQALASIQEASDTLTEINSLEGRAASMAYLGEAHLALQDWSAADTCTSLAIHLLDEFGGSGIDLSPQDVWWLRYQLLKAQPLPPQANQEARQSEIQGCLQRARQEMLNSIASLSDEGLRRNYLSKVRTNRLIIEECARISLRHDTPPCDPIQADLPPRILQDPLRRMLDIGMHMSESRDVNGLLQYVMEEVIEVSGAERGLIFLVEPPGKPVPAAGYGFSNLGMELEISAVMPYIERALRTRRALLVSDIRQAAARNIETAPAGMMNDPAEVELFRSLPRSAVCIPMFTHSELIGALYVDLISLFGVFVQDDLDLLSVLLNQAAVALENTRLYQELEQRVSDRTAQLRQVNQTLESRVMEQVEQIRDGFDRLNRALEGTIIALSSALERRDPYTAGHQQRVSQLACAIAEQLGLSASQQDSIRVAGILHDIGKIGIPSEILNKPGRLSEVEFNLIKVHAQVGYDILRSIEFPWPIARIVLQHHEKMDGSGYPLSLTGEDILLEARTLCVADVVEAMSSHRPYRPALGIERALEEITRGRGVAYIILFKNEKPLFSFAS